MEGENDALNRGGELGVEQSTSKRLPGEWFAATIGAAHAGSKSSLGNLFESCRAYLLLVGNRALGQSVCAKLGASDLVQETFLQAQQIFERFEGTTQEELLAWLTRILQFKLAQAADQFVGTQMRDVGREVPIATLDGTDVWDLRRHGIRPADSVIQQADEIVRLHGFLEQLPPEYRRAIQLRSLEQMSFTEVGEALGRSPEAARKLWVRAVDRLREIAEK
jgi:RNA polymerase sigma-70 factor, ECF subfamily